MTIKPRKGVGFIHQKSTKSRLDTYLKSIKNWLEHTKFNIIVVENSGYHFNELNEEKKRYANRFEVIVFDESKQADTEYLKYITAKGAGEAYAINYAFNNSKLLDNSDFMIKITGRYFIPGLESFLGKYNLYNYDALRQHDKDRCEIVGASKHAFPLVFNQYMVNSKGELFWHVESVYKYRISHFFPKKRQIRCPKFKIEPTPRGGINEIVSEL